MERKGDRIPCYALRAASGLRNSGNPVKKANEYSRFLPRVDESVQEELLYQADKK